MIINRSYWFTFTILSLLSLFIWLKLTYPQMAIINFSIDRKTAITIAEDYLKEKSINPKEWQTASVLDFDNSTNRYLQKTTGFKGLNNFIQKYNYDLFFWIIRYFKEKNKEEYRIIISAQSGEIIAFKHIIPENENRIVKSREESLNQAATFLQKNFHLNLEKYSLKLDTKNTLDHRTEFSFGWHHNDVDIPWQNTPQSGKGKLTTTVTISGDEILSYAKNSFYVPEDFNRSLEASSNIAKNISSVIRMMYFILFTFAIYIIISRRNHLAMHTTKKFYIGLAVSIFIFNILANFNEFQIIIFNYNTTSPIQDQFWRYWADNLRSTLLLSIAIIIPALAGELLYFENFRTKKEGSFLHFIHSTFLSRKITQLIFLGYFTCLIMLGIQSILLNFGQKYLGVWTEYSWANNLSTAYWPFISAFIIGFNASIFEELFYRMYLIYLGKKIFKWTSLAVIFASIFWGFSHTNYPVYPMWFRGLEVSVIGFFAAMVYLNFGIIPVIVGHFLFNVFWNSAGFILGTCKPFYFYSAISLLMLPALWALIAFMFNRKIEEKPLIWNLSKSQQFNLQILESYLQSHPELISKKPKEVLIKEIAQNGWDHAVVEKAIDNVYGK